MNTKPSHRELYAYMACSWFSKVLGDVGASYQMQSYMVILIAYCIGMKEDHQTLLNFAVFAGKWQKTHFLIHSRLQKIFMVGQRGGIAPCPSPLNTPLIPDLGDRSLSLWAFNLLWTFCPACCTASSQQTEASRVG